MVATDANILSLMLHPKAKAPKDPTTNKPISKMAERIEFWLETLDTDGETILIPTPVLSEFLILAQDEGPDYLATINSAKTMNIFPFDERAAIELAAMEIADRKSGDKRGGTGAVWQKVKVDRQIVAICKVGGASTIYTDDSDIKKLATKAGIKAVSSWELQLPPSKTPLFDDLPDDEK
jgi:predicted nucleic acid-binding protein